ncbi:expressed unknown protein [Seminavis robusta]|uniref:Uncharacterized protein n=1 Tax=Seminavis robusta TaxID=568900 RepID=A0A9N8DMK4_9STRA|nr:expressed unknown protein [Seminavis robusta]|eukprot:Sro161_g072640.1 n/a (1881) ;mRNA; f:84177-89958
MSSNNNDDGLDGDDNGYDNNHSNGGMDVVPTEDETPKEDSSSSPDTSDETAMATSTGTAPTVASASSATDLNIMNNTPATDLVAAVNNGTSSSSTTTTTTKQHSVVSIMEASELSDRTMALKCEYVEKKQKDNRTSLDMRRLPVNILLQPAPDDASIGGSTLNSPLEDLLSKSMTASASLLHKTCLNSRFALRTQMMLSFGSVSLVTIVIVVLVSILATNLASDQVIQITTQTFDEQAQHIAGTTAHYLADDLTPRIWPDDVVQIVYEAVRDRFAGYPVHEDDSQVPFTNEEAPQNGTSFYPIVGPQLPLDWQFFNDDNNSNNSSGNVNAANAPEHVQHRFQWYNHSPRLDTSSAALYIQGMCDPDATPTYLPNRYMPNCTSANNDIQTGGVIAPSPTTAQIHRKASDLNPLLKSLHEYHQDIKNMGIYFSNSGAGATVIYPHYEMDGRSTYTSAGCNWMLDSHPIDPSKTFASLQDFERCELNGLHRNAQVISSRLYNPMDRKWCTQQALNPRKVHHEGPYNSAWHDQWLMTIGRSIYDRITNEFIACIGIDFTLDSIERIMQGARVTPNSEVTIVRFNPEGTLVSSTAWDRRQALTANETDKVDTIDEIQVGLSAEGYQEFYSLVDYKKPWDPAAVTQTYENFSVHHRNATTADTSYLVSAFPIPPVPEHYDKSYRPEFLVVVSMDEEEWFERSENLQESVDKEVVQLERVICIVGFVGLGAMVIILAMVAHALTAPLTYMNQVADDIVNNFGDTAVLSSRENNNANTANDGTTPGTNESNHGAATNTTNTNTAAAMVSNLKLHWCTPPKTELDDIVKEFLKMVRNFSGSAMAKNARERAAEIDNRFNLMEEFKPLYQSRNTDKTFQKFRFPIRKLSFSEKIERKGAPPYRVNFGRAVSRDSLTISGSTTANTRDSEFARSLRQTKEKNGMRSPLFFWIVVLIVTPLLLTTITISGVLMANISRSFPDFVNDAKEQFVSAEIFALHTYVGLRANLTAAITERATRDLHVLTRYTGWSLFGGLQQQEGFAQMTSGIEECKVYPDKDECPYFEGRVCDCAWGDTQRLQCVNITEEDPDPRYEQYTFFTVESHDSDADGDRMSTSYPKVSSSGETTAWWTHIDELPGADRGLNETRYETTYDRLHTAASVPVIELLYNYDSGSKRSGIGLFIAFEDDGIFSGFEGCADPGHPGYSEWHSNVGNGAYDLRPELCPLGKYGYDPRCRNWYHKGREAVGGNRSAVYATPPYLFAGSNIYAQSAASPLFDPKTGKHVGTTLVDYISQPILDSLDDRNFALSGKGFPVLITIEEDNFKADTVIGPGRDAEARPIAELILPNDPECGGESCEDGFHKILKDMKAGNSGNSKFTRMASDGAEEAIYISYAPVVVKTFSAVDSSDYSRGVQRADYLLYSLAFAEFEDAMLDQFVAIEEDIDSQFYITLAVLCITIILSTAFIVYFSKVITVSMTEPMLHLLELIKTINRMKDGEDRPEPPMDRLYGSWEVLNVTCTMERLYKVIRSANAAFFAGDVETAYEVLKDALKLFKRLGNKKAIGVACNNLGNTLLAAYRTLKATKQKRICGFKKKEIIAKGTACFHEAIQQGEKAYDDFYEREGWSPNCLDFMQHLSNRYFNRAMFLLTVKADHPKPDEIQELGMRDLQISRDMDVEIVDEGTQVGWDVRGPDKTFEVMLSRFKGHLVLLEMGYSDEFELEEWMLEAVALVRKELKNQDTSVLFHELGPAGRMQQIEHELVHYFMLQKDYKTAARIGIRMLYEDEFTLPSAQLLAVRALLMHVGERSDVKEDVKDALAEYLRRVEMAVQEIDVHRASQMMDTDMDNMSRMSFSANIEESSSKNLPTDISGDLSLQRRISLAQSGRGDITMEQF